jgi:predicted nucleic acid-binding protein
VTRNLLDTNIIGHVTKPLPSQALLEWLADQADDTLFISSLSVAEIGRGILERPSGKKRGGMDDWFSGPARRLCSVAACSGSMKGLHWCGVARRTLATVGMWALP